MVMAQEAMTRRPQKALAVAAAQVVMEARHKSAGMNRHVHPAQ
jgi:hypothetical protein